MQIRDERLRFTLASLTEDGEGGAPSQGSWLPHSCTMPTLHPRQWSSQPLSPSLEALGSTCSSPPGRVVAHCAVGDGHVATAAALAPSAAAQQTARAWPAAGELLTSGQRGKLAGPGKAQLWAEGEEGHDCWGTEYLLWAMR